jgi:protein phosphatase
MTNDRPIRPPSPTLDSPISPPLYMQCPNPGCLHPSNVLGKRLCDRCQAPLAYRYLWAIGESVTQFSAGELVGDRYVVMNSHIWLETKPTEAPDISISPDEVQPYLQLYPQRLHVPGIYGFCVLTNQDPIFLLDNVPIDAAGKLYPALVSEWSATSAVRQVYWLWQMLQLWEPLKQQGVASSLLMPNNLRVEGWRVRLCELIPDRHTSPQLKDLANCWRPWMAYAQPRTAKALQAFIQNMQFAEATQADLATFGIAAARCSADTARVAPNGTVPITLSAQLNQILLEQAAQQPLHLEIFGATTTGPQRSHNEDACFPILPIASVPSNLTDKLLPHVGIICDGIGGHEGGEVASQLALSSLKLQISALIHEHADKSDPTSPAVIEQQLASITRVTNNLISTRNNVQDRAMRQRMGTTLVMAIQLPQSIAGNRNAHELYLVNVGDSRAYWITPRYCHALTVDDDVVTREVSLGRHLYAEAMHRPDSGALTQALGTREGELLHPKVQRFIVEEDGLLLLCSDGLSDGDRVEKSWETNSRQVLRGEISLEQAVRSWVDLANQKNGHDNTSVVMLRCRVTDAPFESDLIEDPEDDPMMDTADPEDFTAASRALLYGDDLEEPPLEEPSISSEPIASPKKSLNLWVVLALGIVGIVLGGLGIIIWQQGRLPESSPLPSQQLPSPTPDPN